MARPKNHSSAASPERDILELNFVNNGSGFGDRITNGPAVSRRSSLAFFVRLITWDRPSFLCDLTFIRWMGMQPEHCEGDKLGEHTDPVYVQIPNEFPTFIAEHGGIWYMPNIIMVSAVCGSFCKQVLTVTVHC